MIWSAWQPSSSAALAAVLLTLAAPCSPVAALAFPALTTTARMSLDGNRSRHHFTGAAQTRLVVNVPATEQGPSATSKARSSPPEGLMPAFTAPARNPWGMNNEIGSLIALTNLSSPSHRTDAANRPSTA